MHSDAIAHNYAQLCNWEEIQILGAEWSKKKRERVGARRRRWSRCYQVLV